METLTINKIAINALKSDIKKLSEEQKLLRNQRKTINLKGERTMEPWVATMKHQANREKLRIMFAAYGLMKGKSFVQIEPNSKWEKKYEDSTFEECHPLKNFLPQISKVIEQYSKTEKNELQK